MHEPTDVPSLRLPCIYCGKSKKFTDEHVFPAGIGGDDQYLLKEMVCHGCNNEIFSPLEEQFMRNSPLTFPRMFTQEHGRGKGKKKSTPQFHYQSVSLYDPDCGLHAEAEIRAGGQPVVLLQVLFFDQGIHVTGTDESDLPAFYRVLASLLGDSIRVVVKTGVGKLAQYHATAFVWDNETYRQADTTVHAKPPKHILWKTALPMTQDGEPQCARLFQRGTGQLELRLSDEHEPERLLGLLRKSLQDVPATSPRQIAIINPGVTFALSFDPTVYGKVIAKIGVNLAIFELGEDYMRNEAFDKIKSAILTSHVTVALEDQEFCAKFTPLFASVPQGLHVMGLLAYPTDAGQCILLFIIRLYGGLIHIATLSQNAPPPTCTLPTFFTIDYNAHTMRRYSGLEFASTFPMTFPAAAN